MIEKRKISTLLFAISCICLLTFAQVSGITFLILFALIFYLGVVLLANEQFTIPLFLFFLPWSTILKLSPGSISFCSLAIILVFVCKLFRNIQKGLSPHLLLSVVGILIVTLVASATNNYAVSLSFLMFMAMLVAYPLLLKWTSSKVNFETCILFYSIGIISATIVAFVFEGNENLTSYITVLDNDQEIIRRCGFYGDPNFYASQIITAIGSILLILSNKSSKKATNAVLLIVLIMCGAISLSKSYIICLAAVFAAWLFFQMRRGRGKFIKALFVVVSVVVIGLVSGAFSDIIDQYLVRFAGAGDASSLTTGRSELWKEYFDFFISNPLDMLLGQGYTSVFKEGVHKGSHNTLIQCVYQLGLIGSAFFAWWTASTMNSIKCREKIKFSGVILLIISCFSMWMGLDMMFVDDLFLNVVVFALGLKYMQSETLDKNNIDMNYLVH